jgi:hypothetical protein
VQVVPNPVNSDLDALPDVVVGQSDSDVAVRPVDRNAGLVGFLDEYFPWWLALVAHCSRPPFVTVATGVNHV